MVVIDSSVRLRVAKNRDVKLDSGLKAKWDTIRSEARIFESEFLSSCYELSVQENYEKLNAFVASTIAQHVPQKLSSSRKNVPWITPKLRCMCRKKQRYNNRAKRSGSAEHWARFKEAKSGTARAL